MESRAFHDDPASAYELVSSDYEHGRPAYAADAVAYLVGELELDTGSSVLDLGAGTGKLTRMLVEYGLEVVCVDRSPAMLAELRTASPQARAIVGTAEAIPLRRESVDAATVAQAFHWFDAARALAEIHRVLRAGGGLALVWNKRDEADPVQVLLSELTDPPGRATPRGWQLDVPGIVAASGLFGPASSSEFRHAQPTDASRLLSRLRSSSFVAGLPEDRRHALERRLLGELEEAGRVVEIAYTTIVYTVRRA